MARSSPAKRVLGPRGLDDVSRVALRCGLCGKTGRLAKTECCGNWLCADEGSYVPFSYARNSCQRNHGRLTLCGYHHVEEHPGSWKDCVTCRADFEAEMYVYYGTNKYNFEKLEHPPAYKPTRCATCNVVINLGKDSYSCLGRKYWCQDCSDQEMREILRGAPRSEAGARQRPASRVTAPSKKPTGRPARSRR